MWFQLIAEVAFKDGAIWIVSITLPLPLFLAAWPATELPHFVTGHIHQRFGPIEVTMTITSYQIVDYQPITLPWVLNPPALEIPEVPQLPPLKLPKYQTYPL